VLSTMAILSPKPGKPQIKETDVAVGDLTGIIGLTGYSEGSLTVSFPSHVR
jgi:chemotaxis protein CheX